MSIAWAPWRSGLEAGAKSGVDLQILDDKGKPVAWGDLEIEAERKLHCMVMGEDLSTFLHIHVEDAAMLGQGDMPADSDTTLILPISLPGEGRYVAGIEVEVGGKAHVAYAPLRALAPPPIPGLDTSKIPRLAHPARTLTPPFPAVSAVRSVPMQMGADGKVVGRLEYINLTDIAMPWPAPASFPPDSFNPAYVVQLSIAPFQPGGKGVGGVAAAGEQLPGLKPGVCYAFSLKIMAYPSKEPITDLVPYLGHAMHLAAVPHASLWILDHFHAMVAGMHPAHGAGEGGVTPCDLGDEAMPEAPASFGPDLMGYYSFSAPGIYRLVAQSVQKGGHMALPHWFVNVAEPPQPPRPSSSLQNAGQLQAAVNGRGVLVVAIAAALAVLGLVV